MRVPKSPATEAVEVEMETLASPSQLTVGSGPIWYFCGVAPATNHTEMSSVLGSHANVLVAVWDVVVVGVVSVGVVVVPVLVLPPVLPVLVALAPTTTFPHPAIIITRAVAYPHAVVRMSSLLWSWRRRTSKTRAHLLPARFAGAPGRRSRHARPTPAAG